MSVDRNIYVGPYVRCVQRAGTETYTQYGCPSHGVDRLNSSVSYCPMCGTKSELLDRTRPKHINPYEVVGDELHGYEDEDAIYLFENGIKKCAPDYGVDMGDDFRVDQSDMHPTADIIWFKQAFAAELDKLREAYDNVEVRWGVHQWFS